MWQKSNFPRVYKTFDIENDCSLPWLQRLEKSATKSKPNLIRSKNTFNIAAFNVITSNAKYLQVDFTETAAEKKI